MNSVPEGVLGNLGVTPEEVVRNRDEDKTLAETLKNMPEVKVLEGDVSWGKKD